MKAPWKDGVWVAARIFVGLVFAYAGFAKLLEPSANFEATLLRYGVLTPASIPWIARIVPWLEWILGGFLIAGYAPRLTSVGTAALAVSFLATLTSSKLFLESGTSDCGCFGGGGLHLSLHQIFAVDLVSLAICLRLAALKRFPMSLHSILLKEKG